MTTLLLALSHLEATNIWVALGLKHMSDLRPHTQAAFGRANLVSLQIYDLFQSAESRLCMYVAASMFASAAKYVTEGYQDNGLLFMLNEWSHVPTPCINFQLLNKNIFRMDT